MSKTSWVVTVEEDPTTGDMILPLNKEILEAANLKEGDPIEWFNRGDGSWEIRKIEDHEETEWVKVDCVASYRMSYMVEVPKGKADWALDTVTMQEAKEFSQEYLGEQIFSYRVVTEEEALEISDKENEYGKDWPAVVKIKNFFTSIGDTKESF